MAPSFFPPVHMKFPFDIVKAALLFESIECFPPHLHCRLVLLSHVDKIAIHQHLPYLQTLLFNPPELTQNVLRHLSLKRMRTLPADPCNYAPYLLSRAVADCLSLERLSLLVSEQCLNWDPYYLKLLKTLFGRANSISLDMRLDGSSAAKGKRDELVPLVRGWMSSVCDLQIRCNSVVEFQFLREVFGQERLARILTDIRVSTYSTFLFQTMFEAGYQWPSLKSMAVNDLRLLSVLLTCCPALTSLNWTPDCERYQLTASSLSRLCGQVTTLFMRKAGVPEIQLLSEIAHWQNGIPCLQRLGLTFRTRERMHMNEDMLFNCFSHLPSLTALLVDDESCTHYLSIFQGLALRSEEVNKQFASLIVGSQMPADAEEVLLHFIVSQRPLLNTLVVRVSLQSLAFLPTIKAAAERERQKGSGRLCIMSWGEEFAGFPSAADVINS